MFYFDTAPSYGDGLAEREIGRFARSRRDKLVIATKCGISPNSLADSWPSLRRPVQAVRAVASHIGRRSTPLIALTGEDLRISVDASLRRLNTDYLDVLLLHEPHPDRIVDPNGLVEEAKMLVAKGKVRFFGVAGRWAGIAATVAAAPELGQLVQCPEDSWNAGLVPDLTYSVLSQGPQGYFGAKPTQEDVSLRLKAALRRRADGAVIVSSTDCRHIEFLAVTACDA
jgi:aryl-alcohol dehydrogenase-like predicted oxidoreductase